MSKEFLFFTMSDTKKEKKIKYKDPNAPKRPAPAFGMFRASVRGPMAGITAKWKEMPAEEKEVFRRQCVCSLL